MKTFGSNPTTLSFIEAQDDGLISGLRELASLIISSSHNVNDLYSNPRAIFVFQIQIFKVKLMPAAWCYSFLIFIYLA